MTSRPQAETQPARTALSWQRTGLGVLAVAALLARAAVEHRDLALVALAAVATGAAVVLLGWVAGHRAASAQRAARTGGDARAPRSAALATGLVVLTALCALAADLLVRR